MALRKVLSVTDVTSTKAKHIRFTGEFFDVFGNPQNRGRWFVWGESGSGKSSFIFQLLKEFARTEKTLLVTNEEERSDEAFQDRFNLFNMHDVKDNLQIIDKESLEDLSERLKRRNSPRVVIIDSVPYMFIYKGLTLQHYFDFVDGFPDKLIVFIAHADGKKPASEFEKRVMYDATQKVFVSGYVATNKGRKFGPYSKQLIIWKKGYEDLMGAKNIEAKLQDNLKRLLKLFKTKYGHSDETILEKIEANEIELTFNDNE